MKAITTGIYKDADNHARCLSIGKLDIIIINHVLADNWSLIITWGQDAHYTINRYLDLTS